jgi:hypothetical protein
MGIKKAVTEDSLILDCDSNEKVAGETGLEPAAFCVTGRRYNQLNYSPGVNVI